MSLVTLSNIEKHFGRRVLFDGLDLNLYAQERVGLIGDNGSGKSTLLKLILGELEPDSGIAAVAKSVRLGHLMQDPVFDPALSVMDEAELAFSKLHELSHLLRDLEHEMAHVDPAGMDKLLERYQTAQHDFELAGGYAWQHRLEATLLGVGLNRDVWELGVSHLSGGQRSRLALAKLLVTDCDLLLLDEPTNHLDLVAIQWLEKYLLEYRGTLLLISHDRYLLDRLTTRIVWLDGGKIQSFPGNYSSFVQQKQLQELTRQRAYSEQQADIAKQQEFIRRFGAGQRSREAKGREKRLNRLLKSDAMVQEVTQHSSIRVALQTDRRAGDRVLTVQDLSKSYDAKVLWKSISFQVQRGERVGIIGPNGSGKTTLLEVLLGRREPDEGQSLIKWGANLNIGYYDQRLDDFDPELTVMEQVRQGRDIPDLQLRQVLALMLFRGDDLHKPMEVLSGGERARVALAQLLIEEPNVLLLDEPTNHLDIASREALEGAMGQFAGTLLCVSHDRYFLDRTVQRLLVLQPPGLVDFAGNYSAWTQKPAVEPVAAAPRPSQRPKPAAKPAAAPRPARSKADNPYLRPFGRLSLGELESRISRAEAGLADFQNRFGQPGAFRDPSRGQQLQTDYQALQKELRQLEEEYFARQS